MVITKQGMISLSDCEEQGFCDSRSSLKFRSLVSSLINAGQKKKGTLNRSAVGCTFLCLAR